MLNSTIRSRVILPCAALVAGACAMQAATVRSEKFQIPFEFRVQRHTFPAGEYRVEQSDGSDIAILVNTKTGTRTQFIRPASNHEEGSVKLVFEDEPTGHLLKKIF